MLSGGDVEWRDGQLVDAPQTVRRQDFDFGAAVGIQRMTRYPAGEQITVPRHVETATCALRSPPPPRRAPAPGPAAAVHDAGPPRAMRTPRGPIERAVARLPEGPSAEDPPQPPAHDRLRGPRRGPARRGLIPGVDVYGLTAVTIVEGALRLPRRALRGSGALAPSQAYDPADFLAAIAHSGIAYEITDA